MGEKYEILVITPEENQDIQQSRNLEVPEFGFHKLDMITRMHQLEVAKICKQIGIKLGLSKEDLSYLVQAAEIHDIGKMGIPLGILNKPGNLTEQEYTIVKAHVKMSEEILSYNKSMIPEQVREIVNNHHERLNGEGYPYGLKGPELNKLCRILHVADQYEALRAKRPYKEVLSVNKAFHILAEDVHNGKIDPSVVEALKEIVREKTISQRGRKTRGLDHELSRSAQ